MKKKLLGAALVTTGLMAGCDTLYHDNDTLMVHGFVVPAGQTTLGNPRKDANPADEAAPEDKISASKHIIDENPEDVLLLILRAEDDIIAKQTIKKPDTWPTAYQLKFNPPAVDTKKELWLDLRTIDKGKPLLVYSKQINLDSPVLFNTERDIVVTEYEKNLEFTGNDKQFLMNIDDEIDRELASFSNEDLQRYVEEKGYPSDERQATSPTVFETFKCTRDTDDKDYDKEVNIYFAENFVALDEPRKVLPRLTGTPVTVYRTEQWQVEFSQDYTEFKYIVPERRTLTCLVNAGTYLPSVKLDADVERAPEPREDKSGQI